MTAIKKFTVGDSVVLKQQEDAVFEVVATKSQAHTSPEGDAVSVPPGYDYVLRPFDPAAHSAPYAYAKADEIDVAM
ncbi:hypothetical protein [Hymenobacter sp. BT491]|uniref:hypothetical protein n=1 Tax=Hymenobacter sp. BT491 TaxID=2766779 RepID=UPI0016534FC0|nr:hypothetical protein [Hymenobacter sp. BT491]MBC6988095.1 hypothetical protein [Hymenobacter sp. BT491]